MSHSRFALAHRTCRDTFFFMKTPLSLLAVISLTVGIGAVTFTGCTSLVSPASQSSLPVQMGAATTNDANAVAYVQLARQLNQQLNPTQTEPLVDALLGGVGLIVAAGVGFWVRHQTGASIAAQTNPPPKT